MQNKYLALALVSALAFSTMPVPKAKTAWPPWSTVKKSVLPKLKKATKTIRRLRQTFLLTIFMPKLWIFMSTANWFIRPPLPDDITNTPEYKEQLKTAQEDVARKVFLEKKVKSVVTDAKIKEAYNKYKSEFQSKKEIKARHILVSSESQANDIIAQLKKGAKFDELAKKYSKDKAVDLGYFTEEMMVPEFGKAVFAMKKGQVSQAPVKTQFGYHVVSVDDVRDSKPLPLKDLRQQIEGMLTQQEVAKIFNDLNNGAKVEKYSLDGKVMPNKPAK